jgi:AraC-like DNA-binding protein
MFSAHNGSFLRRRRFDGLEVSEIAYTPRTRTREHAHERAGLGITLSGRWKERLDTQTANCGGGSIFFRPAGAAHTDDFDAGARCLLIELDDPTLRDIEKRGFRTDRFLLARSEATARLGREMLREIRGPLDAMQGIAVEGLLLELLASLGRTPDDGGPRQPHWLREALKIIAADDGAPVSLRILSEACGVHSSHFARVFRRCTGSSVGSYVRNRQLARACNQIVETDKPLAQIALESGFSHQSHFTAQFRQRYGCTPARYRRSAKSRDYVKKHQS